MHLELTNFRRFAHAKINLDADVIALVGPNEAGKSSVLEALAALEDSEPFEAADITDYRALDPTTEVLRATYLLEPAERSLSRTLGGKTEPRWLTRSKLADGKIMTRFMPDPEREPHERAQVRDRIAQVLSEVKTQEPLEAVIAMKRRVKGRQQEDRRTFRQRLEELMEHLADEQPLLPRQIRTALTELATHVPSLVTDESPQPMRDLVESLGEAANREATTPAAALSEELESRRPRALLFHPRERNFQSEYESKALAKSPQAVANLLVLGGTSLDTVRSAMATGDPGRRRGLEQRVNDRLRQVFTEAWGQSDVYPEIAIGDSVLRLHVPSPASERGSSLIAERSDGLKAFIGLLAFTRRYAPDIPPVLLLDEAEHHLHYDAQADLVTMFHRQEVAGKIIYSTHSAGCLPHDLGSGIRVVRPDRSEAGGDQGTSTVVNSFWEYGPGHTPLLLLMGARALAFAPSRRSLMVLGEGGSELVLLPPLFREVASHQRIDFQVAPGLSNLDFSKVGEMELEAARVCYLVDGDREGQRMATKLEKEGVPPNRILSLPPKHTVEDLIHPELLANAVNEELRRSGHALRMSADELPPQGRIHHIARRCSEARIPIPNKIAVARLVIEVHKQRLAEGVTRPLLENRHRQALESLHLELTQAFKPLSASKGL